MTNEVQRLHGVIVKNYMDLTASFINSFPENIKTDEELFNAWIEKRDKIKEIVDQVILTPIYAENKSKIDDFRLQQKLDSEEIPTKDKMKSLIVHFLVKFSEAPINILLNGVVIFVMPLILEFMDKYIEEK